MEVEKKALPYQRDTLLKELRDYVIEISFNKVSDGSLRTMRCTLAPKHLPKSYVESLDEQNVENKFHNDNPDVIAAWDVQKGGWRSFRIDSILPGSVQILSSYQ